MNKRRIRAAVPDDCQGAAPRIADGPPTSAEVGATVYSVHIWSDEVMVRWPRTFELAYTTRERTAHASCVLERLPVQRPSLTAAAWHGASRVSGDASIAADAHARFHREPMQDLTA